MRHPVVTAGTGVSCTCSVEQLRIVSDRAVRSDVSGQVYDL